MNVEGVWKVEFKGPYGWQKLGTAFLQDGRYLAGSVDHYSIGSYETNEAAFSATVAVTQLGKVRTAYGMKKRHMDHRIEGKVKNEDKIVARANPRKGKKFDVKVRMKRLGDLD